MLASTMMRPLPRSTIGATYWKRLGPAAAYVLRVLIILLKPILVPLAWFNRLISPRGETSPTVSRAELEILAAIGRREGTLHEEEWRVVRNVMNLGDVQVADVMTPRTHIAAVAVDAGVAGARAAFREHGNRRYPVYQQTIDDVIGVVTVSEIMRAVDEGTEDLRPLLRPVRFVPETKPVEALIRELRSERLSMAIVIDEFGGTAGLVTLEDLIEEIVGDIRDEHDPDFEGIRRNADGSYDLAGTTAIGVVNDRLGIELDDTAYATLAGYVIGALGRLGRVGDVVPFEGGRFQVTEVEGRRIATVRFTPGTPRG